MTYFEYLFLGAIEGLTEFLPISSTAHLILISNLLKIPQTDFQKFFEIFIQSGAVLAVLFAYFETLKNNKDLLKKIFVSLLPTIFWGLVFYRLMKNFFFENNHLMIFSLFFVALIFLFLEFLIKKEKIVLRLTLNELNYPKAFLIGIFQSLAILPGISRAGAVIVIMLLLGFKREEAVFYSFLLALPTIVLAGVYDFYKIGFSTIALNLENLFFLLLGFFSAFIFALFAIKWFIRYVQKNSLNIFAYYRIIIAILFFTLLGLK